MCSDKGLLSVILNTMKKTCFIFLLLECLQAGAQKNKFSVSIGFRPELTTNRDNISYRSREHNIRYSINPGIESTVQYDLPKNFFIETGIGFVYRRFKTAVFFDDGTIGLTAILVIAKRPVYMVFEFPIELGYNFILHSGFDLKLKGGYIFNYLWSADYLSRGDNSGSYPKRYWLGSSPLAGAEIDYKMKNRLSLVCAFNYAFNHFNARDPYLFSQDGVFSQGGDGIPIEHHFVSFLFGVKKKI